MFTGESFNGGYGQGSYAAKGRGYIFFGEGNCTSQQVKKPVIFVDGFDPDNSRRVWDIWDGRINREFEEGGVKKRMGDSLVKDGYDIIIYDYDEIGVNRGGAGFIENNALAFAQILRFPLHKVFFNNGARFYNSCSQVWPRWLLGMLWLIWKPIIYLIMFKLTFSFDGPNQGAQIPLGIQQFVDLITQYGGLRVFDAAKYGFHQSNAAKQMLLHHSYTGSETVQAHPFRQKFLDNLALVGQYPQKFKKSSYRRWQ